MWWSEKWAKAMEAPSMRYVLPPVPQQNHLEMLPIINSIQVIPVDSTLFAAVKNLIQVRSFQGAGFIVKMSAQNELACARPSVDLLPSLTVWKSLTAPQQFGMNTAFFLIFLSGACLNPSKYADFDVETGSGGKLCPT